MKNTEKSWNIRKVRLAPENMTIWVRREKFKVFNSQKKFWICLGPLLKVSSWILVKYWDIIVIIIYKQLLAIGTDVRTTITSNIKRSFSLRNFWFSHKWKDIRQTNKNHNNSHLLSTYHVPIILQQEWYSSDVMNISKMRKGKLRKVISLPKGIELGSSFEPAMSSFRQIFLVPPH